MERRVAVERGRRAQQPDAEHRDINGVRIAGIERRLHHAAAEMAEAGGVDLLEALAAVMALVEAGGRGVRRHRRIGRGGGAVQRGRGAEVNVHRIARVDGDGRDGQPVGHRHRGRDQVPALAAVHGLVEADTGLGVARAVLLAGAGIDHLASGRGIDGDRADGVRVQPVGAVGPLRRAAEGVRRHPDAAAGGAENGGAGAALRLAARRQSQGGGAAGRCEVEAGIGDGSRHGRRLIAEFHPGAAGRRAAAHHRLVGGACGFGLAGIDAGGGISEVEVAVVVGLAQPVIVADLVGVRNRLGRLGAGDTSAEQKDGRGPGTQGVAQWQCATARRQPGCHFVHGTFPFL